MLEKLSSSQCIASHCVCGPALHHTHQFNLPFHFVYTLNLTNQFTMIYKPVTGLKPVHVCHGVLHPTKLMSRVNCRCHGGGAMLDVYKSSLHFLQCHKLSLYNLHSVMYFS